MEMRIFLCCVVGSMAIGMMNPHEHADGGHRVLEVDAFGRTTKAEDLASGVAAPSEAETIADGSGELTKLLEKTHETEGVRKSFLQVQDRQPAPDPKVESKCAGCSKCWSCGDATACNAIGRPCVWHKMDAQCTCIKDTCSFKDGKPANNGNPAGCRAVSGCSYDPLGAVCRDKNTKGYSSQAACKQEAQLEKFAQAMKEANHKWEAASKKREASKKAAEKKRKEAPPLQGLKLPASPS